MLGTDIYSLPIKMYGRKYNNNNNKKSEQINRTISINVR